MIDSRLNELLKKRRISNAKLAEMSGISAAAVGKILGGTDLKVSSLVAIAKALNVPISYFFDEEKDNNSVTGHQSIAGSGNVISGNTLGLSSAAQEDQSGVLNDENSKQIISIQKDEIIGLQKKIMSLQEQLLNALTKTNSNT